MLQLSQFLQTRTYVLNSSNNYMKNNISKYHSLIITILILIFILLFYNFSPTNYCTNSYIPKLENGKILIEHNDQYIYIRPQDKASKEGFFNLGKTAFKVNIISDEEDEKIEYTRKGLFIKFKDNKNLDEISNITSVTVHCHSSKEQRIEYKKVNMKN